MFKKIKNFLWATPLIAIASSALAQDLVEVSRGTTEMINRHGICMLVNNASNRDMMVATRTAAEWGSGANSFVNNVSDIPDVTVRQCSRTSTAMRWRFNFDCPNAYRRQYCYADEMSKNGRFAYVLESGDSGLNEVKFHIYRVNEASQNLTRIATVGNLS